MFRRNLELTADVISNEILEEILVFVKDEIVEADARTDEDLFDLGNRADAAKEMQIFRMIHDKIFARLGSEAFSSLTHTAFFLTLAGGLTEVGGGTAHVMDVSLEVGEVCEHFCFANNGILASGGDGAALVIRDGAEIARAVATANVIDGEFDLLDGGNTAKRFIGRVIISFVGKLINRIKLVLFERERRRILNDN